MSFLQAIILGIIEGITEYLPVSSTGHLLIVQRLMGIPQGEVADAFAIIIQAGAIVAVLGVYGKRVLGILQGLIGKNPEGLKLAINLIVAFIPAAVLGLLFDKKIEAVLFGPTPIVIAWLVGAVVMLAYPRLRTPAAAMNGSSIPDMTWKVALVIGFAQALALMPGTSRSLATIFGAIVAGMALPAAVEFSFLLGVMTLGAATAYKGLKVGDAILVAYGPITIAVGLISAWLSATLAVKWMIGYLNKHGLIIFAAWRIIVAVLAAALIAKGVL